MSQLTAPRLGQIMAEVNTMSRSDYEKVWGWNGTVSAAVERTVHSLVEEQAAARPGATAVSAWDGELTYSELDSLASRLALHLSSLGVGAEVVVPLCFEKSRWTVVAMLAVSKAGGAFAAMDASQPLERLRSIVKETRATIMLYSALQAGRWSGGDGTVTGYTIDAEWFATSGEEKQSLVPKPVNPSSALYVVFTSGSTGKPKGVVITHTAFSSAFANQARSLGFHTESRTFDFASYAFDISVSNFFMTLASGGCLCVPSDADRQNDLGKAIRNSNATLVHLTPSTARLLDSRTAFNLDTVLFIGEPMGLQDSQGWRPTTRIINTYGPAECTPISTINASGGKGVEVTHIGRGAGAVTWVVDPEDDTRLSPIGSVGELLIEGPIVGRGYLYDAEKTAASFIQDPPWLIQGPAGDLGAGRHPSAGEHRGRRGRLYKTGDLVRYNDDGSLVFVGRKDTQVKIHGQRVELGEIEHHVQVCVPGARQVAVDMFVPSGDGATPMLAAFIVMTKTTSMTNGDPTNGHTVKVMTVPIDVGKALAEQLPTYMVPAVFFAIDNIPVNSSGKRDRKKLQAIGAGFTAQQLADMRRDSKADNKSAAPSTEAELALQEIWARVLNLKAASIKAEDSFFHLGGDSLAAIKLVALARHKGRHIAVADVFRNPKLADLAALCTEVADVPDSEPIDQRIAPFSLLRRPAADHQRCREEAAASCQVTVGAIQDAYPCTPLQEGLLALTVKSKSVYVLRNIQQLAPNIHLERFQAAWAEAVRRMAILRTRIVQDSHEGLLQVVVDEGIEWTYASSIRAYMDSAAPMGLGQRLARFALVNDAESGRSQFVLTMHHAVYDDHFWYRLRDLVARMYRSSIPLGEDIYAFKLFVKYTTSIDTSQAITYWRGELAGYDAEAFPSLPVGAKANGWKAGFGTIERRCAITPIAQSDVTVATLVRAAWALTAAAATGTKDVVFGATVSGRHAPVDNIDTITGPTIATVPVRIFVEPGQSIRQFLRGVQEQSTDMITYEQTGLQHIQRASNDAHRACQFQTLMVIHPQAEIDLGGGDSIGTWDPTVDASDFDNYALTLNYTLSKKAVTTHAAYNKDYLTEDAMSRLLERFESALHQLALATEEKSISDIDVMSQSDYDKIWKWNGVVPAVVERTVHSLVEEQAAAKPDAMAVSAWDGELTYGELDSLASRLARHLSSSLGVGTEVVVPLCFERSMWTVVSMLAVLKAGGAFTLMEATQPLARLRSIVEQTRATVMLCSSLEADRWSRGDGTVTALTVDAEWFTSADVPKANGTKPKTTALADVLNIPKVNGTEKPTTTAAASYVVFTSGSTGTPKGVVVTHSAFSSALVYQSGPLGYHCATRVFDFASYAFDMAVETAFFALASGLCFCVPSDSARKGDLTRALTEMHVDHVKLTPSAARTINRSEIRGLKTLLFGGEGARRDDMNGWETGVQIIATYGPAECTPNTTLEPRNGGESIGKAVGAVTWLVNPEDDSKLVPVGSVGELLIEGPIVGRGYLYDAEKTEAAFIHDPLWLVQGPAGHPGAGGHRGRHGRLYKTGDLARYNDDGSLVFIGRKDTQVKIRGQRVELGEIEHHIQVCLPDARQVAAEVFIPSGDGANPILGAFIVMADNINMTNGDLTNGNLANGDAEKYVIKVITLPPSAEEALAERLSSYMVPSIVFAMDNIPVNTSGKTDRKRLREIGASFTVQQLADIRRGDASNKREPTTEAERALQQIWARVLNLDPASIGTDDSFFRLGGDSISAMQVSAMARATIGDISSGDILRKKTISQLISFMPSGVGRTMVASGQTSSHTVPDGTPFPLSPVQKLHVHMNSRPLRLFDQSFFLRLRLRVSLSSVKSALQMLVSRHSMLRARFFQDSGSGVWQQQISDDVVGSFHLDHATDRDAATSAEAIRRCRSRIDPTVGPLVAAVLFDGDTTGAVEHTDSQNLFISIHHLVVDLVSWRVLLQELEELLTSGQASVPPTASFSAWCTMQAQYAALHLTPKASAAEKSIELAPLSYWDLDIEAVVESETSTKHFFLDETTTDALFGPCNVAFGTRPVELLVAALAYSFGLAFPDRPTPTVFSEGHGREVWDDAIDIFRTVGWFTTYFPAIGCDVTGASLVNVVRLVKDSWRRLPANGWSYFTSRFASEPTAQVNSSRFPVEVALNYEGRYQQLERDDSALEVLPLPEDCEPASTETARRYALFGVEANIDRGRLSVSIICPKWPEKSGHQARVAMWVRGYQEALVQLAAQLRERPAELTLADLPMGFQSYDDLASFRTRVLPRLKLTEADIEDVYKCSAVQEGILLAQAKNPGYYRSTLDVEIEATHGNDHVDRTRVERAWRMVVRRHSLLRALLVDSVPGQDGTVHVILRDPVPKITYTKGFGGGEETNGAMIGYAQHELQHHLTVVEVVGHPNLVRLRFDINHAIIDAHSTNVLLDDFRQAYSGNLDPNGPLYRGFIQYTESRSAEADGAYWESYLEGVEPCFLPSLSGGSPVDDSHGEAVLSINVPISSADGIHAFCTKWETTTAAIMQVAWALVLRAFTGSASPCFGILMSGRDVPVEGVHDIFGPLIGFVPSRVALDGPRSVTETLADVQRDYIDSLPRQTYPLMQIQRALQTGMEGLFNSVVSVKRGVSEEADIIGDDGHVIRTIGGEEPIEYDVAITALDEQGVVDVCAEFKAEFIGEAQARRVTTMLGMAIDTIVSDPSRLVGDISLQLQDDVEQIWKWNGTVPEVVERTVHSLVEEQAVARPEATAVSAWDGELTYAKLDSLASRLTQHLSSVGVRTDMVVPLCFEKSMWTVVAMLAVLKAGGAFTLMDASQPLARLQSIVKQTRATIMLCSSLEIDRWSGEDGIVKTYAVSAEWFASAKASQIPETSGTQKPMTVASTSAAYVIFTSGSTGTPKGIVITHSAFSSALVHQADLMGYGRAERVFDFASYAFDMAIETTFFSLTSGRCVCVPSDSARKNDLTRAMIDMQVDYIKLTPSVARILDRRELHGIRTVVLGGEEIREGDVYGWAEGVQVINTYGPAECCPVTTVGPSRSKYKGGESIGRGAGAVTWIVDLEDDTRLAPVGSVGELLIEGPIVGRGYLYDTEKTASAFIQDPPWLVQGAAGHPGRRGRLYKTGDLVRYNDNGSLIFIGRKDSQVKIRGQRVELGEIEHHVQACLPKARQVAAEVFMPGGDGANPMLAAFIVLAKDTSITNGDLVEDACMTNGDLANGTSNEHTIKMMNLPGDAVEALAKQLSSYMVPAIFFAIDNIPVNNSGKTDRKKLQAIGASFTVQQLADMRRESGTDNKRAPLTDAERALQHIWAQVLQLDTASIRADDSFFRLGGDSLAAMKLVALARNEGRDIAVADVFRNPKLADLAALGAKVVDNDQEVAPFSLLQQLTDERRFREEAAISCQVNVAAIQDAYPCTPLQEGLLALTSKSASKSTSVYVMRNIQLLASDINIERFQEAWGEAVRRLPILRTRIVQDEHGGLLQVVIDEDIKWKYASDLQRHLEEDAAAPPMGLGQRLARFALVTDPESGRSRFILTMHHALYDGYFWNRLHDLVSRFYHSSSQLLGEDMYPFKLFVRYIAGIDTDQALAYWRCALAGYDEEPFPSLSLTARAKSSNVEFGMVERRCTIAPIAEPDITTATLVRAAWALTASAAAGGIEDVAFGATVSGRHARVTYIDAIAGPTIATVPVRIFVEPTQPAREFLRAIQEQSTDMITYEQTGLQHIQRASDDAYRACQFQTLLVIQPQADLASEDNMGTWDANVDIGDFSSYALTLNCILGEKEEGAVTIEASFDRDYFTESSIRMLLERFENALHQLALATEQSVGDMDVLSQSDYETIWKWNGTVPAAVDRTMHSLIEEQVVARPEATAISAWDGELTYYELDSLASRLAWYLSSLGVGADTIIPLCFEKSKWTAVSMLAVLKAGGAFALMDASHPVARLRSIIEQTKAPMILCSSRETDRWSGGDATVGTVKAYTVSAEWFASATGKQNPIANPADPTSALYAVFTSGTTGKPKGVVVTHTAFSSAFVHQARSLGFHSGSRTFDFASYAFDLSIYDFFMTLASGGCLCVPSDIDRFNNLGNAIKDSHANLLPLTPSTARLLHPRDSFNLDTLILAGEAMKIQDSHGWQPGTQVINVYGPTECTPISIFNASSRGTRGIEATHIGRGAGAVTWLVNPKDDSKLVPTGAVGELLLEGPLVGPGYLHDVNKTAAAFIQDPPWLVRGAAGHPGRHGRLYKTGDLVRYNDDGSLVFVGRKDTQVKIRGQRVELSEVEYNVQASVPGASEVAAEVFIPHGDGTNPILAAFIVTAKDTSITKDGDTSNGVALNGDANKHTVKVMNLPAAVKEALARRLSSYMVPAIFFAIDILPVNSSGKTDRRKLQAIGAGFTVRQLADMGREGQEKREPSTAAERSLQKIWAQVLQLDAESIGADDSFFRLGGDSIAAMKLVALARRNEGRDITVADVFRNPKLAALAALQEEAVDACDGFVDQKVEPFSLLRRAVDGRRCREEAAASCQVDASVILDTYPCTPLQEGLLALTSKSASAYVLRNVQLLAADIDLERFQAAWGEVVRRMAILRTRIVQDSYEGLLQVVLDESIEWTYASSLQRHLDEDLAVPMGLGRRLARFALVTDTESGRSHFILTMHHALYDGHFWHRLHDLVARLYTSSEPLGGNIYAFNVFVRYVASVDISQAVAYWRGALAGYDAEPFPSLPGARANGKKAGFDTIERRCRLPSGVQPDVTIATLVRAAWALTTAATTGTSDVIFGATVSGRHAPIANVDTIAGPTIATVPVRTLIEPTQSAREFLRGVQDQSTDMIIYEQTGLQHIQRASEDAHRACQFQTLLVIQPPAEAGLVGEDSMGVWDQNLDIGAFSSYALTLNCILGEKEEGAATIGAVTMHASFDKDYLTESSTRLLLERFEGAFHQLASAAEGEKISDMDMLSKSDYEKLWKWNETVPPTVERMVHSLVEEHVLARPEAAAVSAWDGELTYGELDELASRLARHLSSLGVGPEVVVPLCFERSMWTVVSMLAVLKAGGAFTLMEATQPFARLQSIVKQTRATVMLCSSLEADRWSGDGTVKAQTVSAEWFASAEALQISEAKGTEKPMTTAAASYVVFTSGSTGTPKGVVVTHSAFSSALVHQAGPLGYKCATRVFDFASYAFDMAVETAFFALASGLCFCVPSDSARKGDLTRALTEMQVDHVKLTPSAARTINRSELRGLKTLLYGGEGARKDDMDGWEDGLQIIATYGPAECTPNTTLEPQNGGESIGRAVGAVTWLVDDDNKLVPVGSVGELLIEGPIVGRGYLYDSVKTTAAFIHDPPWLVQGAGGYPGRHGRLYKTGDLVRYSDDGSLIFVGRKDTQVKIRGQRVELGEIEHHIQACVPGAKQVAAEVFVPSGEGANPMLAAFIVTTESANMTNGDLTNVHLEKQIMKVMTLPVAAEEALAERLSSYMIPSIFFAIDTIPVNTSGKMDRKRLREIGAGFTIQQLADMRREGGVDSKREPSTEAERALQQIWARVLNLEASSIGADDSFFRLGGDSITAMQVSAMARLTIGDISSGDILRKKTISRLVDRMKPVNSRYLSVARSQLQEVPSGQTFPLSPMQQLYVNLEPDPTICFDQSFLLKLNARVTYTSLVKALDTLVSRHAMLRARFCKTAGGAWEQSITSDTTNAFHCISVEASSHDQAHAIARCRGSLDIESGPLLGAILFEDADTHQLYLTVHHLVIDLVSWRILFQELEELLLLGAISAPPPISFQTWSTLQAQYATSHLDPQTTAPFEVRPPLLSYWEVDGAVLSEGAAINEDFTLDAATSSALLGSCNDAFGTRPVDLMVAALIYSFSLVFPDRVQPAIFNEGHGREAWDGAIDISRTVGWFTTMFPVQISAGATSSLLDCIRQTKDCIRSFPSNGWSYFTSQFVDESQGRTFASNFPAEIVFNYAGHYQQLERGEAFLENVPLPEDSSSTSVSNPRRFAMFDVLMNVDRGNIAASIVYHKDTPKQQKILDWVAEYKTALVQIARLLPDRPFEWTLSDFPLGFKSYGDILEFQKGVMPRLGITRADAIEDIFPCSPIQESILISQAKESGDYRTCFGFEFVAGREGERIDFGRLQQAWQAVVRRHALLRAVLVDTFPGSDRFMQVILRDPVPSVSYFDGEGNKAIDSKKPVGYEKHGLQHHLSVWQIDSSSVYLRLEMNHAINDGHSTSIIMHDLLAAYRGTLDPVGVSYRNYIDFVEQQSHEADLGSWTQRLAGIKACIFPAPEHPADRTPDAIVVTVPNLDADKIHAFCAQWEVTPATIVQTAWALVLSQYTRSTTPCFGTLCSGRDLAVDNVEEIFGPLIGILPCRVDLERPQSVLETLKEVQLDFLDSLSCQVPLTAIHVARKRHSSVLFNSALSFQKGWENEDTADGGVNIHYREGLDPTEFDIYIRATDSNKDLNILLDIRAGCHERDEATQIASSFSDAISSIITNYESEIRQLQKVFSNNNPLTVASSSSDYGSLEDEQTKVSIQGTEELKQVERIIRSHKSVDDAVAVWKHAEDSQRAQIVAFVTLGAVGVERQIDAPTQSGNDDDDDEALRVQFWDAYWEGCTYTAMDNLEAKAIGRDFLGWTSTYNGKEIDKAEMNEWLDDTIKTIVDGGSPTHILEIGTGSGMILFNLINDERSYVGLEMSKTAVEFVTKTAKSMSTVADRIHIIQATASDLDSLDIPTSPELVIINSVAQYFPTQNYLLQVLESILRLQTVRTVFFGDIRSHCLYDEFLGSKALYESGENPTKDDLRASMTATAQRELELLIDPAFFTALPSLFPGVVEHVEILPKRVKASNELSCYRYAAVVHVKSPDQPSPRQELHKVEDTEWVDFVQHGLDRERLLRRLENSKGVVAVSNIPNSKTAFETLVVSSIRDGAEHGASVGADWLTSVRQDAHNRPSLSTLDLAELAQQAGYRVELSWGRQHSQRGGIDAIFHHYQPCDGQSRVMFQFPTDHEGRESRTLSNHPMQLQAEQEIQEELNDLLEAELPVHLLPKQIHVVENLPMDRIGEVDCHTLMRNCESEVVL